MKLITCILSLMLSQGVVGPHVGIISHPVGGCSAGGGSVAFDAVGPSGGAGAYFSGSATSGTGNHALSWSHPQGTISNAFVIVGCVISSTQTVDTRYSTTVTYNGVTVPPIASTIVHAAGSSPGYGFTQMFGLALGSVSSASETVVATTSWVAGTADTYEQECGSITFSNANQSCAVQHVTSASGTSASPSVVVTSATNHIVVDIVVAGSSISSTLQTDRWALTSFNTATSAQSTAAGASTVTMGYGLSGSDVWGIAGLELQP